MIQVVGYGAYARLEHRLAELGFHHTPEDHITCRYRFHGITVDIMPTDVPAIGPTNRWYVPGMVHALPYVLPEGTIIRVLTTPYFLGTKLEAHWSRGGDMRTSKDFEDIVYLLDGRLHLVDEIGMAPPDIRSYLRDQATRLLREPGIREAFEGHLPPGVATERAGVLLERLRRIGGEG